MAEISEAARATPERISKRGLSSKRADQIPADRLLAIGSTLENTKVRRWGMSENLDKDVVTLRAGICHRQF
jgi:hypothetical protein